MSNFKNTASLILTRVVSMCLNFASTVLISSSLGVSLYGEYVLIVLYGSLITALSRLGLESIVIRDIAKGIGVTPKNYISIVTYLLSLSNIGFVIILFLLSKTFLVHLETHYLLLLGAIIFVSSFISFEFFLQGISKSHKILVPRIVSIALALGLRYLITNLEGSVMVFLQILLFENIVYYLMIYVSSSLGLSKVSIATFLNVSKALLRSSLPLWISSISTILIIRMDQLFISHFLGSKMLGTYSVWMRFFESFLLIPAVAAASFIPIWVKKANSSFEGKIYLVSLITWGLLFFFIIDLCLSTFFGSDYSISFSQKIILLICLITAGLGTIYNRLLTVNDLQKYYGERMVVGVLVNGVLNVLLIPTFALNGALISMMITLIIVHILSNYLQSIPSKVIYFYK